MAHNTAQKGSMGKYHTWVIWREVETKKTQGSHQYQPHSRCHCCPQCSALWWTMVSFTTQAPIRGALCPWPLQRWDPAVPLPGEWDIVVLLQDQSCHFFQPLVCPRHQSCSCSSVLMLQTLAPQFITTNKITNISIIQITPQIWSLSSVALLRTLKSLLFRARP